MFLILGFIHRKYTISTIHCLKSINLSAKSHQNPNFDILPLVTNPMSTCQNLQHQHPLKPSHLLPFTSRHTKNQPRRGLEGGQVNLPSGRVLGGSTAINYMAYVRGSPKDYDLWATLGADGWSWKEAFSRNGRMDFEEPFWGVPPWWSNWNGKSWNIEDSYKIP